MFQLGYASNELRRRLGRTLLTAFGLAAGVGLVIGIIGVSQGLDDAQAEVLAPLRSIGTDILVTRVAGTTSSSSSTSATPTPTPTPIAASNAPRFEGPGFFGPLGGGRGGQANALNEQDTAALLNENSNVVTDLSKLGKPGTKFTHDFFLSGTLLSFPEESLQEISDIDGVASATAGLTLLAQHQTGTVPEIVAQITTGGEKVTATARPSPMTEAEQEAFRACLQKSGVTIGPPPSGGGGPGAGGAVTRAPGPNGAFQKCLPKRFQEFEASVITPLRTIQQIVNPPSTDITSKSYTAAGIDPASPNAGLVTTQQLVSGAWITKDDQVLVSSAYANKNSLNVGSTLAINGKTFTVTGLVNPTLTGNTADVYFTLDALQGLASKQGRVTQVLVKVDDASQVEAVAKRISAALPGAQVVTTKSLADQVTGSLKDARNVAGRLGGALGVIVLAAAFIIAMLLTLSSIAKRVREIGTLRAIGWSKARIVRQVLAETAGIGLLGGVIGIGVGFAIAWAVGAFSPELTATTTGVPGFAGSSLSALFGQATEAAARTSTIDLSAPVRVTTLLLGVAFAVLGGVLAGSVGGWRAARLAPAEALRTIG
jgi:ABC-type antimicrobial peptide transport system permease subunit